MEAIAVAGWQRSELAALVDSSGDVLDAIGHPFLEVKRFSTDGVTDGSVDPHRLKNHQRHHVRRGGIV